MHVTLIACIAHIPKNKTAQKAANYHLLARARCFSWWACDIPASCYVERLFVCMECVVLPDGVRKFENSPKCARLWYGKHTQQAATRSMQRCDALTVASQIAMCERFAFLPAAGLRATHTPERTYKQNLFEKKSTPPSYRTCRTLFFFLSLPLYLSFIKAYNTSKCSL